MQRLKGILQLAIAAGLVALIVWTNVIPDEGRRIEDAVYVEDGQVLPENEGKRVIVAGTLTVREPAADHDLDITFDSPVIRRSVERLKYVDGWQWTGVSEWSTTSSLTDQTFVGKATLGQFELDAKLMRALPGGERDWTEGDLDAEETARLEKDWYLTKDGAQLYLSQLSSFMDWDYPLYKEYEGAYRLRYRVWNVANDYRFTVVGIQKGSTLCFDSELNAGSAYEGILDADELVASNRFYTILGELIFAAIPATLLIVFGIRNVREL